MKKFAPLLCGFATASLFFSASSLTAQNVENAVEAAAAAVAANEVSAPNAGMLTSCLTENPIWIGGETEQSDLSTRESPWQIELDSSQPQARAFRLSKPSTIRLETLTKNNGDPVLHLLDAAGEVVAQNDDAPNSYNSQIVTELPAGEYCVTAENMRGPTQMTLFVGLEHHESILTPPELACGPQTNAQILGDKDLGAQLAQAAFSTPFEASKNSYIKFKITDPLPFTLSAFATQGVDPTMTLFDAEGNRLAENNDADGVNSRLDFPDALPVGDYCVGLRAVTPSVGKITFVAKKLDIESYKRTAYERGELAPLDGSYPMHDLVFNTKNGEIILQGSKVNWITFELDESSIISLRTLGSPTGADTMLSLFDDSGDMLLQVDDTENSRNAAIGPMKLGEGRYFVALSDRVSSDQLGAPLRPVVILGERYIRAKSK